MQELDGLRLVGFTPFGNLRHLPVLHRRMDVPKSGSDAAQQIELHAPLPHLDLSLAERAFAEQSGLWMQLLEVAADGYRFGDDGAVVELQHRQPPQRIAR